MEAQETGLTKLAHLNRKVNDLLKLKKITPDDLADFNSDESKHLADVCTNTLENLKGDERDNFINKIEFIIAPITKTQNWEINHQRITVAISKLMQENGYMPSKTALASETGLSRQTINKHFKEYKANPEYVSEMEQFKFMASKVIAKIFKFAVNGDVRAARLYLEMVGAINKRQVNTVVNEQNNYIQINNTILSQENLKRLSAEQLNQIENIITRVLPQGKKCKQN